MSTPTSAITRLPQTRRLLGGLVALVVLLGGCTAQAAVIPVAEPAASSSATAQPSSGASTAADPGSTGPVPDARVGKPAATTRVRFIPDRLRLADGSQAEIKTASTVDGELEVPEDVRHLGWWDGSAQAGDPFGSIVVAGHVDSATQGLGFFSKLLQVRKGQKITLGGEGHHLTYVIRSIQTVKKDALSADSAAFGQTGDHRLVLITCGGAYRPAQGGYDSNIVVIATPVGLAR